MYLKLTVLMPCFQTGKKCTVSVNVCTICKSGHLSSYVVRQCRSRFTELNFSCVADVMQSGPGDEHLSFISYEMENNVIFNAIWSFRLYSIPTYFQEKCALVQEHFCQLPKPNWQNMPCRQKLKCSLFF